MINFASGFVVQFALKDFGEQSLAAYGIALRIEQLFLLPALGTTITQLFDWGLGGVRMGIAVAVATGLAVSLGVVRRIAQQKIGGLALS